MSIPSPEWSYFDLGPFRVHAYALCILAGIIVAAVLSSRRLTKRGAEPGVIIDVLIWAVVFGLIGARIYHVLTHPGDYFYEGADLLRVLYIWEGGIAIFGALIGGGIGAFIGCRIAGLRFLSFADAIIPGLLIAQALGRFGNWFNQELFGLPTDAWFGLEISSPNAAIPAGLPEGTLFLPTFLFEMLWNLLGAAILLFFLERKFSMRWGKAFGFYLIWYGIGRTWNEAIRIDPSEIVLGLRVNLVTALIAIIIGVVLLIVQSRRHPGLEISVYRPGRAWVPAEAAVVSKDTYTETGEVLPAASQDDSSSETVPASAEATSQDDPRESEDPRS